MPPPIPPPPMGLNAHPIPAAHPAMPPPSRPCARPSRPCRAHSTHQFGPGIGTSSRNASLHLDPERFISQIPSPFKFARAAFSGMKFASICPAISCAGKQSKPLIDFPPAAARRPTGATRANRNAIAKIGRSSRLETKNDSKRGRKRFHWLGPMKLGCGGRRLQKSGPVGEIDGGVRATV